MSRSGQWDVIVALDERVVNRLVNNFWRTNKFQAVLSRWRSFNNELELAPTPYRMSTSVTLDFVQLRDATWLDLKLAAVSATELTAEVAFKLKAHVKVELVTNLNPPGSARAGTLFDVNADAEVVISAKSRILSPGTVDEQISLSFSEFQLLRLGLIDDENLPESARAALKLLIEPRLRLVLDGVSVPIAPLAKRLIDTNQSAEDAAIRDVKVEFCFASFPRALPDRPYASLTEALQDENRNTAIIVGAAFYMTRPSQDLPDPSPRPIRSVAIPVSEENPGAILFSQRILSYLSAYLAPPQIVRFWGKALGRTPRTDKLYRFMLHPDTRKPIAVDNSRDETIVIEGLGRTSILRNGVDVNILLRVCKSGPLFFGAPDPHYGVNIFTSYRASDDGKRIVTKDQAISRFYNRDGLLRRIVGGLLNGVFDAIDAALHLIKGDLRQAFLSFAWAVGQPLGAVLYIVISPIVVYLIDPDVPELELLPQPFKIKWADEEIITFGFKGDARFYDGARNRNEHNPFASMLLHFIPIEP